MKIFGLVSDEHLYNTTQSQSDQLHKISENKDSTRKKQITGKWPQIQYVNIIRICG